MSLRTGLNRVATAMQALAVIVAVAGLVIGVVYSERDAAIGGGMAAAALLTTAWILKGFTAKDGA